MSEEKLRALADYQTSSAFNETEKLVLEYADRMTQTPLNVSDEFFARLRQHFDDPQLVELTSFIAFENYRARFNHAFALESENLTQGAFCPAPLRRAPAAREG